MERQTRTRPHTLLVVVVILTPSPFAHGGEEAQFNSAFLRMGAHKGPTTLLDTRQFRTGNPLVAGTYPSDIYINEQLVGHGNLRLATPTEKNAVSLCLDQTLLDLSRFRRQVIPTAVQQGISDARGCITPEQLDAEITWQYDLSEMTLHMSIPQRKQEKARAGGVDPSQWNWGEPVAYLNYNANLYGSDSQDNHFQSRYLGLQAGLNVGAWRVHHQSSLQQSDGQQSWQSISTYGERSLPTWHSRLRLGQGWTSGAYFDSVGYQGINLASDERMLPETQRGYAPTVFGIARTYAHVKIEQNGYLLYETTVAPGSFAIDDLAPTGYGGDLKVTITESDGSSQSYTVPFATTPGMVRLGSTRYTATVGQVRDAQLAGTKPLLGQITLQHGLTNQLSVYTGASLMQEYNALLLGAGVNSSLGSFSVDVTHSNLQSDSKTLQGQSWRATYSKQFTATHTNLSLASYRYSSDGYRSLHEAIVAKGQEASHQPIDMPHAQQRLDLTLSQPIGEGNVYLTGSRTHYWHLEKSDTSWQLGYSNRIGRVNYQISGQHLNSSDGHQDTQLGLSLSMPLGESNKQSLDLQLTQSHKSGSQIQASLGGVLGEQNEVSYGLTASKDLPHEGEQTTSLGTNGSYRSQVASVTGSYSRDNHGQQQYSVGVQGALLAHDGTITALPHLGDTFAVVAAPDAAGARIKGHPEIVVDDKGYAVVPDLIPYSQNQIELDPEGIKGNSELASTSQWVVPDAGAAPKLTFATRSGQAVLFTLKSTTHQAIPFGTPAQDSTGKPLGFVGQGGKLYARLEQPQGDVQLQWQEHHCEFHYQLPAAKADLLQQAPALTCQQ